MRLSPLITNGYFKSRKNPYYNLRSDFHLENSNMHTVHFRSESVGGCWSKIVKTCS